MQTEKHSIENFIAPASGEWLRRIVAIVTYLMIPASVLSGILTAVGIFNKGVEAETITTVDIITALCTASIAALLVAGGQILLFNVTVRADKSQRRQIIGLTAVLIIFTLAISSYSNIIATAGSPSLVYAMRSKTLEYTDYVERSVDAGANAKAASDALLPVSNSICALAEKETTSGLLSGSAGRGAVAAAYSSSCTSLETITGILNASDLQAKARKTETDAMLQHLHSIPRAEGSIFARQAAYRDSAAALRNLVTSSGNAKRAETLKAQMAVMAQSVASLETSGTAFGKKQDAAVSSLKSSLEQVADIVGKLTEYDASFKAPDDLPDMMEAIMRYPLRNAQNILISIMIDGFPIFIVFLLGVARRSAELRLSRP